VRNDTVLSGEELPSFQKNALPLVNVRRWRKYLSSALIRFYYSAVLTTEVLGNYGEILFSAVLPGTLQTLLQDCMASSRPQPLEDRVKAQSI
jgi:hypothetical protein